MSEPTPPAITDEASGLERERSPLPLVPPSTFARRLRETIKTIGALLDEYKIIRYGDASTTPPMEPQIYQVSDPYILLEHNGETLSNQDGEAETPEANGNETALEPTEKLTDQYGLSNPLLSALVELGELDEKTALTRESMTKVAILKAMGVTGIIKADALIDWADRLAAAISYILEAKTTYSEEVKAKYPELLIDLQTARGIADKLSLKLRRNKGFLSVDEYPPLVGDALHYAKVVFVSARQLPDYHEEFASKSGSPLDEGFGRAFVEETEAVPSRPRQTRQETLETSSEE